MSVANAVAILSTPQPLVDGRPLNPKPGNDGQITSKA
jgi:hypothetical protein